MEICKSFETDEDSTKPTSFIICQKNLKRMIKKDLRKVVIISQAVLHEICRIKIEISQCNQEPNRESKSANSESSVQRQLFFDSPDPSSVKDDLAKSLKEFRQFRFKLKRIMKIQGTGVLSKPVLGAVLRGRVKRAKKKSLAKCET
ncbi:unnamed protein product [Hermetia illucens]|uniref:Uncharacterized protein n=1 Tax=Hermetia illucens TaxID=343691 RepID=A0A7R8UM68_HERIL|nr:unnamed protein product [Hermetia illucens]